MQMERPIDSHQWATKIEIRCLLSSKPDLRIKADSNERRASLEKRIAGIGRGIEEIQARASDHENRRTWVNRPCAGKQGTPENA